jgi:hypothetical protein
MFILQKPVAVDGVAALSAGIGYPGQIAIDQSTGAVWAKLSGGWAMIVDASGAAVPVGGSGTITVKNSSGSITRSLTAVAGVVTLAATDTIVANGDATTVEGNNNNALAGGESTMVVAAGVLSAPKLNVATVTLLTNGAQIAIKAADGVSTQPATLIVAAGANNGATLLANIALVPNLLSVVLHKSDGTVSAGSAGLNSPAVLEISGGKIQDVKAGA